MNNFVITPESLKATKKAVNQAKYLATAERKAKALELLTSLTEAVANLEEVKPKPKAKKKAKKKSKTSKAKSSKKTAKQLAKLTKAELIALLNGE